MSRPTIQISAIGDPLPALEKPFAVLVETSDKEWANDLRAKRLAEELLAAGCRYFVCFGPGAEAVHDSIDEIILEHEYSGITTTFHESESKEDAAEFFKAVAAAGMKSALVLVCDVERWKVLKGGNQ